ncbi:hypothetical protein RND71_039749 [Anisodus tanguticus]|uniref:40S ribosomal protein S8 n=1 Tax=Anisodus tanguticus TaxID=243964 RepID=A0AAE1QXC6_9SOLA|nr:hypothetical protein RND71_039749 [Anisodus tanguticus]
MGISRDSMHKRPTTGGKKKAWRKKRKYDMGIQPANTKRAPNTKTHYGVEIGHKKKSAAKKDGEEAPEAGTEEKKSNHVQRKLEKHQQDRKIDPHVEEQVASGRLLATISSRPGQCGRANGYILEDKELEFYMKKL